MPIRLECHDCGRNLQVKDAAAGRRVKCPDCGSPVRIPDRPAVTAGPGQKRRQKATSRQRPQPAEGDGELDFGALASMAAASTSLGAGELQPCLNCGRDVGSKARECPYCGENLRDLKAERREEARHEEELAEELLAKQLLANTATDEEESGMSYFVFFMIFVVGNAILYFTTGWFIIPRM